MAHFVTPRCSEVPSRGRFSMGGTKRGEVPGWVPRLVRYGGAPTPSSVEYSAFSGRSKVPNAGKRGRSHPIVASSRERRETVENCPTGMSGRSLLGRAVPGGSLSVATLMAEFPPARFHARGQGQTSMRDAARSVYRPLHFSPLKIATRRAVQRRGETAASG